MYVWLERLWVFDLLDLSVSVSHSPDELMMIMMMMMMMMMMIPVVWQFRASELA